jgi:hypothetical protein
VGLVGQEQSAEIALGPFLALAISRAKPIATQLWEAQARSRVPSTERCSELSSGLTSGEALKSSRNQAMSFSLSSRSPFLVNVAGCQTGLIRVEADEPAEQQVAGKLLHQHPLRADAVDRLQQKGQQQLLGRDRGPDPPAGGPGEGNGSWGFAPPWRWRRTRDRAAPAGRASTECRWAILPQMAMFVSSLIGGTVAYGWGSANGVVLNSQSEPLSVLVKMSRWPGSMGPQLTLFSISSVRKRTRTVSSRCVPWKAEWI